MRKRAARVDATQARAVEAACALLGAPTCSELTLERVAAAAGVTRATMYNHFGSRRALLLAVFREVGRRMQAERIQAAMRDAEPNRALARVLEEASRGWARQYVTVKRLFALAALDREIGREVASAERERRASLGYLAERLVPARGADRAGTVLEAARVLGALTSFQTYEALRDAGGGPSLLVARLVRLSAAALGSPHPRPMSLAKKGGTP